MTDELSNPHLADLAFLVGDWDTGTSGASFLPAMDTVVHRRLEGRLVEDGRLLALRQTTEASGPPGATWVIGRDDDATKYTALDADERGVSRVYAMTFGEGHCSILRDDPHFSQRFDASISTAADTITGEWKKRGPE